MILTTLDILSVPRCEPWTDERTIEFMNSGVYTNSGEKTISEFIQSVGILDITYSELFWIVLNNISPEELYLLCTKLIEDFALDFNHTDFVTYMNLFRNDLENIQYYIDFFEIVITDLLQVHGDVTNEIKLYKMANLLLVEFKEHGDFINLTKKILGICKSVFPEVNEESVLNYLSEIFD